MNGHLDILKIFLEECDSDPFLDVRSHLLVKLNSGLLTFPFIGKVYSNY